MGTTPVLVKPPTQANTTDFAFGAGGTAIQADGQVVALTDGGYLVVWTDGSRAFHTSTTVLGQRYDAQGERVGGEFRMTFGGGDQSSPAVTALPGGGVAVAFVNLVGGDQSIWVHRYDSNLSLVGTEAIDTGGNQTFDPAITPFGAPFGGFGYAVSYTVGTGSDTDIVARLVFGNVSPQFDIHNETDNSHRSELAMLSNGDWVAVFQDEFNGNAADTDILFRIFDTTSGPVTGSVNVPGGAGFAAETEPDVAALTGGGFVVVWTDQDSTVTDIRATILTDTGGTVNFDIIVNSTQAGGQDEASVVGLLDGGFLVTWDDDNANVIRAQRFDAVGNRVGDQFTVHSSDVFALSSPEAARLADGRVAFTFTRESVVAGDSDVFTSIWNPRGTVAAVGDVLWQQADGTVASGVRELASASPNWQTQGVGNFDADGDGDVLWRHRDGAVVTWELQNGQLLSTHSIAFASVGWTIQGLGDFDGDGDDDVLWRHQDGAVVTWEMQNQAYVQNHNIAFASVGWTIQGLGDFDGDSDDDIIWRHQDGAVVTWEMQNDAYVVNHNIAFASTGWTIRGTGDFDGDGDDDILWHHIDGAVVTWQMQNGAYVTNHNVATSGGGFQIAGTGDFNADGTDDLLWRQAGGGVATWQMRNGELFGTAWFGVTGNDWQIRGTGEFDLL